MFYVFSYVNTLFHFTLKILQKTSILLLHCNRYVIRMKFHQY